jgi:hypothetical protein
MRPFRPRSAAEAVMERFLRYRSAAVLVAANLVPLGGVLFLRWSVFEVVFLFWGPSGLSVGSPNRLWRRTCSHIDQASRLRVSE